MIYIFTISAKMNNDYYSNNNIDRSSKRPKINVQRMDFTSTQPHLILMPDVSPNDYSNLIVPFINYNEYSDSDSDSE